MEIKKIKIKINTCIQKHITKDVTSDLDNVSSCGRQQSPVAQSQGGGAGRQEVGLIGLEGPDVKNLQLFVHARRHHIPKEGPLNN